MRSMRILMPCAAACLAAAFFVACGGGEESAGTGRPGGGPGGFGAPGGAPAAAVPVEVAPVERRSIASYLQTNGTLEAENEVDVVARAAGPIVVLRAEEGQQVASGQVLARLDDREIRAQLEIANVNLAETELVLERAERSYDLKLISREELDRARSDLEGARAQVASTKIQLDYTTITAPFSGLVIARYVKFAQMIGNGTPLFRISDFDPLLCPIQVPERELSVMKVGQAARLTGEAFPGESFEAKVLRISPVVEAATGTVKVTLAVNGRGKLRPGMFASVFLRTDLHEDTLAVPKAAMVLESLGDTVYVVAEGEAGMMAERREVTLGFQEETMAEVLSGVNEGERVVVVGQEGLSDGTPISILSDGGEAAGPPAGVGGRPAGGQEAGARGGAPGVARPNAGTEGGSASGAAPPGRGNFDPSSLSAEQIEAIKKRMRDRGMTDEQIEERLKQMRERSGGEAPRGGGSGDGGR